MLNLAGISDKGLACQLTGNRILRIKRTTSPPNLVIRGEGRGGELKMPGRSWRMQWLLVEIMYFCPSHRPSHEMHARPVNLWPFHTFDDGSDRLKRSLTIAFGLVTGAGCH